MNTAQGLYTTAEAHKNKMPALLYLLLLYKKVL